MRADTAFLFTKRFHAMLETNCTDSSGVSTEAGARASAAKLINEKPMKIKRPMIHKRLLNGLICCSGGKS